jgi:nicotinate-nucleotide pyrophosphorylase (carboxylating)
MFLPREILEEKLLRILAEDVGQGDVTTGLVIPAGTTAEAEVISKEPGVVAGIEEIKVLIESLGLMAETLVIDGEKIRPKQVLIKVFGDTRTILSVERTLLNILSRMSGIATTTRKLTERIEKAGLRTKIACTRKTAPGLMYFDKKAVLIGGGDTHRLHLDDMILIKDNHIAAVGSLEKTVRKAKEGASFSKKIEVEVSKIEDVLIAAKAGADIVMLDNFPAAQVEKTVRMLREKGFSKKILIEASGGITTENVMSFASTGADVVSLGAITSGARTLNINLEIVKIRRTDAKSKMR